MIILLVVVSITWEAVRLMNTNPVEALKGK